MLKWTESDLVLGCGVITHAPHDDNRGRFMEIFNRDRLARSNVPIPWSFPQANVSYSRKGVLRGFHVQRNNPQGKLVTCLKGRVLDVCFDIRKGSKSYMSMSAIMLDERIGQSFYLPAGTAHAFLAMDESILLYHCSSTFDAESDAGFNSLSDEIASIWPDIRFIRSDRDKALPSLGDYTRSII